MIQFTTGNLLESSAEALVNTVNTVGVMGKGIALMFKERFPENTKLYAQACKDQKVHTGQMFVTETNELLGPKWIINFPTKQHWRAPSKLEWITEGLQDLKRFLIANKVRSVAIPPLGAGNGGLNWHEVKPLIVEALSDLDGVDVIIYEPTSRYQNVAKKEGVKQLTPERAMIAELIRQYSILGLECSLLEVQKLAWFLERAVDKQKLPNRLKFNFEAHYYGPYSNNLSHLLNRLDGTYLLSEKRIPDAKPTDTVDFNNKKAANVSLFLKTEAKEYLPALQDAVNTIEGFESPFGMELLATVDWLLTKENCEPTVSAIKTKIANWAAGPKWAERKLQMFNEKSLQLALDRLAN